MWTNLKMRSVDTPKARNNELAQIHIAIADLRWTDDDYRSILLAKTGKRSAGELDSTGRKRFLEHLRACGWNPKAKGPSLSPQQWRIKKLWQELGAINALQDPSDKALMAFVKAHSTAPADALKFITPMDARNIIDALQGWLKRVRKK
jgi:phage gp16-like protein